MCSSQLFLEGHFVFFFWGGGGGHYFFHFIFFYSNVPGVMN